MARSAILLAKPPRRRAIPRAMVLDLQRSTFRMAANLAPVYVNNDRVTLQGDPRPNVAKIVTTLGKKPENVRVVLLSAQGDRDGSPLSSNEVIDRSANAQTPIYLKCFEEGS